MAGPRPGASPGYAFRAESAGGVKWAGSPRRARRAKNTGRRGIHANPSRRPAGINHPCHPAIPAGAVDSVVFVSAKASTRDRAKASSSMSRPGLCSKKARLAKIARWALHSAEIGARLECKPHGITLRLD